MSSNHTDGASQKSSITPTAIAELAAKSPSHDPIPPKHFATGTNLSKPGQSNPGKPKHQFDKEECGAFFSALTGAGSDPAPDSCVEQRVFNAGFKGNLIVQDEKYPKTFSGWFRTADAFLCAAGSLTLVSGYVTVNPVNPALLARADGKLAKAKKDQSTQDGDILCFRWLYVDIDPIRPSGISATQDEMADAIAVRDQILADLPELAASAIWGNSGNGGFILIRLPDYPNDARHKDLIVRANGTLRARFNTKSVEIDRTTTNPSRVMCLPGTMKCKGSHLPERPWRPVTFDSWKAGRTLNPAPLDLEVWLSEHEIVSGPPKRGATAPNVLRSKPTVLSVSDRASAWVARKEPAIDKQGGSAKTFDVAMDLIHGFDLSIDEARPILREYSARCLPPWSDAELEHKLEDADKKEDSQGRPRGWLRDAPPKNGNGHPQGNGNIYGLPGLPTAGEGGATQDGVVGDLQFAMTDLGNARRLAFLHGHEIRYCSVLKCWHVYQLGRWAKDRSLYVEQMARDVVAMIAGEADAMQAELNAKIKAKAIKEKEAEAEREKIDALRAWAFRSQSARAIRDMIQLAQSEEGIPVTPEEFDRHPWLLNFRNGTLNLRDDSFEFRAHDPADMLSMQTACDYNADATCPRFDEAMRQITAQDATYEAYLDRTIGASLTGQPSEQEFYMPFGKGRNGKNVWLDLNREALGDYGREAEPSLLMASKNDKHPTGLADLSGARLVTLGETEDGKAFAEAFLKRITGNTTLKARLMHKDFFGFGRSFTIFLATNYEPEIKGKDHAIWERIKVLPFPVTFVDDESEVKPPHKLLKDRRLMDTLRAEFSGILNRAIQACRKWQRGGMRPPRNVAGAVSDYRERMDHAQQFVEACFERFPKDDPKARVETKAIYQAYYFWCEHNEAEAESPRVLGSSLESLGHTIQKSNGKSYRRFLKVKPPEEPAKSEQVDQK